MKHGKRPTVSQKKLIKDYGLNPDNWLVSKNTPEKMVIVHRHTDTIREIKKGEYRWNT